MAKRYFHTDENPTLDKLASLSSIRVHNVTRDILMNNLWECKESSAFDERTFMSVTLPGDKRLYRLYSARAFPGYSNVYYVKKGALRYWCFATDLLSCLLDGEV